MFVSLGHCGRPLGELEVNLWQLHLEDLIAMSLSLHFFIGMLEGVVLENHCNELLCDSLRESFAKADSMASEERSVGIWVARLAIWSLEVLGVRVEALRNVLVVPGAPQVLIVMEKVHHDMDLLALLDFELLFGSLGESDVLGDSMRS